MSSLVSARAIPASAALVFASFALFASGNDAAAADTTSASYDEVLRAGRIPRLPAPFSLPELTHRRIDVRMDWFVGESSVRQPSRSGAVAGIARPSIEGTIRVPTPICIGATYPIAVALPPDGGLASGETARAAGTRALPGNVEAHVRAVFTLPAWLEFGFTLGVVAPTATFDRADRANRSAVEAAAALDPTSYVHFLPHRFAFRPAGDLRIVRAPFVFQGRHGLDLIVDDDGIDPVRVAGRLIGHVGYLVRSDVEVSVEASQLYFFGTDTIGTTLRSPAETTFAETYRISDNRRAAFAIGPGVRFAFRDIDVGAALVTNMGRPLSPVTTDFVGLRISVIGHVGGAR